LFPVFVRFGVGIVFFVAVFRFVIDPRDTSSGQQPILNDLVHHLVEFVEIVFIGQSTFQNFRPNREIGSSFLWRRSTSGLGVRP
jgi:hypothetical protein